ncbi:MAG: nicotinate-nucleotide--dimethylbenzimidazole phosphoribosyltransferase, partial [Lachnospiraceae bacterium]|nr:nicotinate-nucleotide--dimethylbenzimidazole phosphoribosyltransferase [Lachnospiraceae bacterium]
KDVTGRGAGLNNAGLLRKRTVIEDSLARYNALKTTGAMSEKEQALFALIQLGGFDIAGLVGVFIGGSVYRIPIVIDGLISSVAALIAEQLVPGCRHYMIASHSGREGGTSLVLQRLNLPSYLNGNMALGEGTGALLLFPLLDAIAYYYYNGAMFADANIKAYERFNSVGEIPHL